MEGVGALHYRKTAMHGIGRHAMSHRELATSFSKARQRIDCGHCTRQEHANCVALGYSSADYAASLISTHRLVATSMAQRAIREADGKSLLKHHIELDTDGAIVVASRVASATVRFTGASPTTDSAAAASAVSEAAWVDFEAIESVNPWVTDGHLVVKPDQLIKRRGKGGLILLNASWEEAKAWISRRAGTSITVDGIKGRLEQFIIEPFLPHTTADEYYVCIQATREGDEILFHHEVSMESLRGFDFADSCKVSPPLTDHPSSPHM